MIHHQYLHHWLHQAHAAELRTEADAHRHATGLARQARHEAPATGHTHRARLRWWSWLVLSVVDLAHGGVIAGEAGSGVR